ncbi:MAG: SpoIID/LytB domain-containing protein [Cyanobacteria bacterium P01_F01_bin.150]
MTAYRCQHHQSSSSSHQQGLDSGVNPASSKLSLALLNHLSSSKKWWSGLLGAIALMAAGVSSLFVALPAQAALELRVAIEQDTSQVNLGTSTSGRLLDGRGQVIAQIPAGGGFVAQASNGSVKIHQWTDSQFWIEPTGDGIVYIGNKWYRGRTRVVAQPGGLTAVNYVDLEHYLYSVVGGEMPTSWPLESLKAQAVAARSYVLYRRDRNQGSIFDVGDTTAWQVYRGLEEEASSTLAAVDATQGQVMTHNNRIIEAVFHSSSGGHTEDVEDIWSSAIPYLRGVVDFDQAAPVYQWNKQVSASELQKSVSGVGNIFSFTPVETTPRGRVVKMQVQGDQGSKLVDGSTLRSSLGLRSTLFAIAPEQAGNVSTPSTFSVYGRGFGHGVGMSQWGAHGMANQGYGYQQILGHFYQGTSLAVIDVQ